MEVNYFWLIRTNLGNLWDKNCERIGRKIDWGRVERKEISLVLAPKTCNCLQLINSALSCAEDFNLVMCHNGYTITNISCAGTKSISDRAFVHRWNTDFGAVFVLHQCSSALILIVNHLFTDRFSCFSSAQCEQTSVRYKTIHIQDRSDSASLRHKNYAEISVLCVNKRPIRYGFRAGARIILLSGNTLSQVWAISVHTNVGMISYPVKCRHRF